MINQVNFEGILTRSWEYRERRYMRPANHRPAENGKDISDYITVFIDSSLDFNPSHLAIGQQLHVIGRIIGRDIVEPLRLVVSKSHNGIELPGELNNLVIHRPTVQILATQVKIIRNEKNRFKSKPAPEPTPSLPMDQVEPGHDLAELITPDQS
jgi:hypothetical protein